MTVPGAGPEICPDFVQRSITATTLVQLWVADITFCPDGHLDEVGRRGYLSPTATSAERAAYELSSSHRSGPYWTDTCTLRALHWPAGAVSRAP